ncbi:MAG: putative DNA-binding domain-containing protein [Methylococcales bacterium]
MNSKPFNLKQQQADFTAYIRDPLHRPMPPELKPERMKMYAELIFNNVESFLSSNFPVLNKILSASQWQALIRDFFIQHANKTPYFCDIPQEFLSYLQDERNNPNDFPFLLELAHYEWAELALSIAEEELAINSALENLMDKAILLSPLSWLLAYQYPVQKISPDFLPTEAPAEPTFLIVYRDQQDEVGFIALNPITYRLLNIIQENPSLLTRAYLQQIASESKHPDPEVVMEGGLQILKEFAEKNIITAVS